MFTGLVEAKNELLSRSEIEGGVRMRFSHEFDELSLGESIAMNGACLTVVSFDEKTLEVELSNETLALTTLGGLNPGTSVNMERALRAGDRLGGHMVTGHVDGIAKVTAIVPDGDMKKINLEVPEELSGFVARKGSLTVDGVSLTVNAVESSKVSLLIIPHTLEVTTLGDLLVGSQVNVEVDLVARYVERLLEARGTLGRAPGSESEND